MIIAIVVGSVSFLVPLMYGAVIETNYDKWQARLLLEKSTLHGGLY